MTIITSVLASDLQPGDELHTTAFGGYSGRIHSVQVGPKSVRVQFDEPGPPAYLAPAEICQISRERRCA